MPIVDHTRTLTLLVIMSACITTSFLSAPYVYAKVIRNPLVYHLSSDEPWRASVAISDGSTQLKLGHNVTLLLSVEGVQIGVILL